MHRTPLALLATFFLMALIFGGVPYSGPSGVVSNETKDADPLKPSGRIGHGLVYHERLARVLLVGGQDSSGTYHADVWSWDGLHWELLDAGEGEAPSPRSRFAIAYDAGRDRVVLHGGGTRQRDESDTWEWDVDGWTRVDTSGMGARSHHSMAYDPVNENVLLFGGGRSDDGHFYADTWSWDGTDWSRRASSGPPGRVLYAVATDPQADRIYLFGGFGDGGTRYADLWRWDGSDWGEIKHEGPEARLSSTMVVDQSQESVFLFGGVAETELGDMWSFAHGKWKLFNTLGPRRDQHAIAYDAARERVVLFGGELEGNFLNDLWEWSGSSWTRVYQ